jgi:Flagellar hook capping protein
MSIDAISAAPAGSAAPSTLGLQDFMKILLTQLTYQDPLKPMDNQAFMAQMAQFTSLEQAQSLNGRVQQLIENQAALQSVGLIGRTVDVATSGGTVTGTVLSLALNGEAPLLSIAVAGGSVLGEVGLGQVLAVR